MLVGVGIMLLMPLFPQLEAGAEDSPVPAAQLSPLPGIDVEKELEDLVQSQRPAVGDAWGGAWANEDGTITVSIVGDASVPSPLSTHPKVRVVSARHSTRHLESVHSSVVERLNQLLAPGAEPGSLDLWPFASRMTVQDNIIDVDVDSEHQGKQAEIEEALADEMADETVRVAYKPVGAVQKACGTRQACTAPFRGGIQVVGSNGGQCTLGFVLLDGWGRRYQSTASHCSSTPWSHGGRAIGPTVWTGDSGNIDFLVIQQNNQAEPAPTNWVYRNSNPAAAITSKIYTPDASLHGINICQEGQVSGSQCGALLNYNSSYDGRCCFGTFSAITCFGDSGAPVLNNSTLKAYGLMRGFVGDIGECGLTSTFTWLAYSEWSGYEVLLSSTTETLAAGQQLPAGYALVSKTGGYNLQMQTDGNLVLYNCCGTLLWDAGTWGNPGALAVMQNDGNLVIYNAAGVLLWNRPLSGWQAGSRLVLGEDSNLVIYSGGSAVWHRWCFC